MRDVLIRFLTGNAINDHPMIYWGMGGAWLVMVVTTIFSIRSQPIRLIYRLIWMLLVLGVPVFGLLLYLLWCLTRFDYSLLRFLLGPPRADTAKGRKAA